VTGSWRLLLHGPRDPWWNMAVDRAIQLARESNAVPPTIRLYGWTRPTVSLGKFQDAGSIDWEACSRYGLDVVRRFTGGRGVLHADEVTYSIVAGLADGVPAGTSASYRHLSAALVAAYRGLGVDATLTDRHRGSPDSAACYLHATRADLSLGESKLSGSAQTWVGSTVLQHGSFTLRRDTAREAEVFRLDDEARCALETTAITLEQAGATLPPVDRLPAVLAQSMAEGLAVHLQHGELTADELETADALYADVQVEAPAAS